MVSKGELMVALKAKIEPEKIVFSGVGKTIFIESLLGLRKIDSGKILIGNDILESKNIDLSKWFENIGYISNNPTFFNDSLFNNLLLF